MGGSGCGTIHTGNLITHASSLAEVPEAFNSTRPLELQYIVNDSYGRNNYWGSYNATLGGFMHEMGHAFALPHVTVGVMATDASAHINRFFSVYETTSNNGKYPITEDNEIRNTEPLWQWWTATNIPVLITKSQFIK